MLEHMIFNLNQLKVEGYVKREPKFLHKKKEKFVIDHKSIFGRGARSVISKLQREYRRTILKA